MSWGLYVRVVTTRPGDKVPTPKRGVARLLELFKEAARNRPDGWGL